MKIEFEHIASYAKELGFVAVGYAPAHELADEIPHYLQAMDKGHFASLEYLKRNLEKRFNPQLLVEGAKSVLVFLAPYGKERDTEYIEISFPANSDLPTDTPHRESMQPQALQKKSISDGKTEGSLLFKVAQYALGEDYHRVIKGKLNAVLEKMKYADPSICGRVFVDTAPVLERAWAVQAGLGFIGKNNLFISREHGIRNFIGVIISNYEILNEQEASKAGFTGEAITESPSNLERGEVLSRVKKVKEIGKKYCGNCTRCLDSCPTGALCAPYSLDAGRCISYLTIEEKGASIASNIGNAHSRDGWIFGCDACLNACPWNSRNGKGWKEFEQKCTPLEASHLRRR